MKSQAMVIPRKLILKRGWSLPRFAGFVPDFMIASLLPEDDPNISLPDKAAHA